MKYYRQVVADALSATPPGVRGLLDGNMLRRLNRYAGSGARRVFEFDIAGRRTYRELIATPDLVALSLPDTAEPMLIKWLTPIVAMHCPKCGLEMLGAEFWPHYNLFHARRPFWLNKEDWVSMRLAGDYKPPPEQR